MKQFTNFFHTQKMNKCGQAKRVVFMYYLIFTALIMFNVSCFSAINSWRYNGDWDGKVSSKTTFGSATSTGSDIGICSFDFELGKFRCFGADGGYTYTGAAKMVGDDYLIWILDEQGKNHISEKITENIKDIVFGQGYHVIDFDKSVSSITTTPQKDGKPAMTVTSTKKDILANGSFKVSGQATIIHDVNGKAQKFSKNFTYQVNLSMKHINCDELFLERDAFSGFVEMSPSVALSYFNEVNDNPIQTLEDGIKDLKQAREELLVAAKEFDQAQVGLITAKAIKLTTDILDWGIKRVAELTQNKVAIAVNKLISKIKFNISLLLSADNPFEFAKSSLETILPQILKDCFKVDKVVVDDLKAAYNIGKDIQSLLKEPIGSGKDLVLQASGISKQIAAMEKKLASAKSKYANDLAKRVAYIKDGAESELKKIEKSIIAQQCNPKPIEPIVIEYNPVIIP